MVAPLPDVLTDLLEVATYVYCADQACPRGGQRAIDYGERWSRTFRFRIPVRCPDVWSRQEVKDALTDTLAFMSDDVYKFDFCRLGNPPSMTGYLKYGEDTLNVTGVEEVCLFSGGLDSLAGAVEEILVNGRKVALVSHRSNPKINSRQRELVRLITARANRGRGPLHVPVWIHKGKKLTRDYMQRTRSFLYASLGVIVARMFDLDRIRVYENGTVSLNLPVCAQVIGARATRTTHPRTIAGFAEFFSCLLNTDFEVENPYLWKTRADVVSTIKGAGHVDLIEETVSCPHTHAMTSLQRHCGTCSQCVDRRFATLAAGCEGDDPAGRYKANVFTDPLTKPEDQTMAERYVGTANKIEDITDAEEFCIEFGEVLDVLRYVEGNADKAAERVFGLYKRHVRQVLRVLDDVRAKHVKDIRKGKLPNGCLLAMVRGEHRTDKPPRKGGRRRRKSAELTPRQEKAYHLIHVRGLTLEQAALEMGCTKQNVQQRLKEAEIKMKAAQSRSVSASKTQALPTDDDGQIIVGNGTTKELLERHTRRKT